MHLNVGKRRLVQHSLLNDVTIKDFDAIAVVEPYISSTLKQEFRLYHKTAIGGYSNQQEGGRMGMHDTHLEQPSGSIEGAQLFLSQRIATTSQQSCYSFREGVLL